MAKLDNICGMGLSMHCEFCDATVFAPFSQFPGQTVIVKKCSNCFQENTLVNDGVECKSCQASAQAAAQAKQHRADLEYLGGVITKAIAATAVMATPVAATEPQEGFTCTWCGMRRPPARFCPHCRLDVLGRPADRGGWNYNLPFTG